MCRFKFHLAASRRRQFRLWSSFSYPQDSKTAGGNVPLQIPTFLKVGADCRKTSIVIKKWGLGRSPKRGEGGSPTLSPARTPGVYAQRLCTMQSQQSIHSLSPGGRGLGIGIKNSHYFIKKQTFSTSCSDLFKGQ